MPGDQRFLILSSTFLAKSTSFLPPITCDARSNLTVLALSAAQKAGPPPARPQRVQPVVAAGQVLPRIALMADAPDDLAARRVEGGAERARQLDDAQAGADVTAGLRHHVDQALPDFVGQLLELLRGKRLHVLGTMDRLENQFGLVTM